MRRHGRVTSAFIRLLAGLCLAVGTAGMALAAGPDPAPRARIYLDWVLRTFDRTEKQIPAITRAAEVAAAGFIEGRDVGVRGGAGLNEELGARSGGLCVYRARKGGPGDVILYAFGVATQREPDVRVLLARELADAEALSEAGSPVIGLASYDQLEKYGLLDRARGACRVLMNNYCPAVDGLFQDLSGRPVIPTFTTANAIVSWVWMAEFFAACTREGKTPAMYQSVLADPDRKRYSKYLRVRFHDDMHVDPVPAGQFGKAYLESLRGLFRQVRTGQWDNLVQAAERAARTILDGGTIYSFARGHYPPYHHAGQLTVDPGLVEGLNMRKINSWRADDPEMPVPGTNDYAIAVGYSLPPGDPWWNGADAVLRGAGRGVCWIISGYMKNPRDLKEDEILLDQCWPHGDAAIQVEGYDVPICPPSGVMGEALMWMLAAEIHGRVQAGRPGGLSGTP